MTVDNFITQNNRPSVTRCVDLYRLVLGIGTGFVVCTNLALVKL